MNRGLAVLIRVLAAGADVLWASSALDIINVPTALRPEVLALSPQESAAAKNCLHRACIFRQEIRASSGATTLPLLILPEAAPSIRGCCLSCGAVLRAGDSWRCILCAVAVYIALDAVDALLAHLEPA